MSEVKNGVHFQPTEEQSKELMMAYYQAIAFQQNNPDWLTPGKTVIVEGEELTYQFVGINSEGQAVNRRPNPNRTFGDRICGKNKFIEKTSPLDQVAIADLVLAFFSTYSSDQNAAMTYFDLDSL